MTTRSRKIADDRRRYGVEHQRFRAEMAPVVATGTVRCWRCGETIRPDDPWDLGHLDDGDVYGGPEHTSCNRRAAAVKGNRMRGVKVNYGPRPGW